jgi:hypothetical protein
VHHVRAQQFHCHWAIKHRVVSEKDHRHSAFTESLMQDPFAYLLANQTIRRARSFALLALLLCFGIGMLTFTAGPHENTYFTKTTTYNTSQYML